MNTRPCSRCGVPFIQTPERQKKRGNICRDCEHAHDRAWRAKRKAEGRPVPHGKTSPERKATVSKIYNAREDVRARNANRARERIRRPEERIKHEARWAARRAVAAGGLVRKPCEQCGAQAQAHHDDYARPLDVRWLCRKHHNAAHHRRTP